MTDPVSPRAPIVRLQSGLRMSQAVIHGGLVHLAGQVAPGDGAGEQTAAVLAKIDALLDLAGSDRTRIVSATIWLADMADFAAMNAVWEHWLDGAGPPARATGGVQLASPDYRVEIIVMAAI